MNVLIFGFGYIGSAFAALARDAGHQVAATFRDPAKRPLLDALEITAVPAGNARALRQAVKAVGTILVCPAPGDRGCPAFGAMAGLELSGKWLGYLSTTGVYGNRDGGWVFEDSARLPTSAEGRRRVVAEDQWLTKGAHVFRLPGLYGPGRNVLMRLRDGTATYIVKPGHVFSRLHHDDCASALMASLARPRPGGVYNLCDDEPAPAGEVMAWAAAEFGLALPPQTAWDDAASSPTMRRFYLDNKRVSNALAKAELGWRPRYPTYREGLRQIFKDSFRNR